MTKIIGNKYNRLAVLKETKQFCGKRDRYFVIVNVTAAILKK